MPWLKFGLIGVFLFFAVLIFKGTLHYLSGESRVAVPKTPMSRHVKVPERVFRGDLTGKKLVALTFDDGPSRETTPRLLDILKEKAAVATFFELGARAQTDSDLTKRVFEEGHEVGSHTMNHRNLVELSDGELEGEVKGAEQAFEGILGRGVQLTRVPYGNVDEKVKGMTSTPLVYWSVDTKDWESKDSGKVIEETMKSVSDGAIVLYHDIYPSTVDAIPAIIDELRGQGYEFVTVSELAEIRGTKLERG